MTSIKLKPLRFFLEKGNFKGWLLCIPVTDVIRGIIRLIGT